MKIKNLLFITLLLSSNLIFAQELSIGVLAGTRSFVGNSYYSANIGWPGIYHTNGTETWFSGLGFSKELQLGLCVNYKFSNTPIGLSFNFSYSPMRGKGVWPTWDIDALDLPPTYSEVESIMDYYSLGVSFKYYRPISKIEPYLALSPLINYFGDVENYSEEYDSKDFVNSYGIRYGLSLGAGADYYITRMIILNGNIVYEMDNLINARDGEDKFKTVSIQFGVFYRIM